MNEGSQTEVITTPNTSDIVKFLFDPKKLAHFMAGILSRDMAQHTLMAGRIVEASIKLKLLRQLGQEIKAAIDEGRLKEDCLESPTNQTALLELLRLIDKDVPDDLKFNAAKAIFLYSLRELADEEKMFAYELQKICSRLSSGEIVVLKAAYEIHTGKNLRGFPGGMNLSISIATEWLKYIAFQIGHNNTSLVELHEENLMKLMLISPRIMRSDRLGIDGKNFRLTTLGIKFCELMLS